MLFGLPWIPWPACPNTAACSNSTCCRRKHTCTLLTDTGTTTRTGPNFRYTWMSNCWQAAATAAQVQMVSHRIVGDIDLKTSDNINRMTWLVISKPRLQGTGNKIFAAEDATSAHCLTALREHGRVGVGPWSGVPPWGRLGAVHIQQSSGRCVHRVTAPARVSPAHQTDCRSVGGVTVRLLRRPPLTTMLLPHSTGVSMMQVSSAVW